MVAWSQEYHIVNVIFRVEKYYYLNTNEILGELSRVQRYFTRSLRSVVKYFGREIRHLLASL